MTEETLDNIGARSDARLRRSFLASCMWNIRKCNVTKLVAVQNGVAHGLVS